MDHSDRHALLVGGRRRLLISGAIHYARSTPDVWPRLLDEARALGCDAIETYVFWGLHERVRGVADFSGRLDLPRFLGLCHERGLGVILRVGPYACAEIDFGGLPRWLRDLPRIRLRTADPAYQAEVGRWLRLLAAQVEGLLAPRGGPVLAVQAENEYSIVRFWHGEEGHAHLRWLVDEARQRFPGVPVIMCNPYLDGERHDKPAPDAGWVPGTIETINHGEAHRAIPAFDHNHPEGAPLLWTEAWTGWYRTWGGPEQRRTPEGLAYAAARWFAAGGTGINLSLIHI
jgi:beta-galactosidase